MHFLAFKSYGLGLLVFVCFRIGFGNAIAEICGLYNQMLRTIAWFVHVVHLDQFVLEFIIYIYLLLAMF